MSLTDHSCDIDRLCMGDYMAADIRCSKRQSGFGVPGQSGVQNNQVLRPVGHGRSRNEEVNVCPIRSHRFGRGDHWVGCPGRGGAVRRRSGAGHSRFSRGQPLDPSGGRVHGARVVPGISGRCAMVLIDDRSP